MTGILWFGVNLLDNSVANLFGIPVILFCAALLLYEDRVQNILAQLFIFWIIMTGMEFLFGWLYLSLLDGEKAIRSDYPVRDMVVVGALKALTFLVLRIAKMFLVRNKGDQIGSYLKYVMILPLTTFITYCGIFYVDIRINNQIMLLYAGCVLLLFSNIVVFYILEKLGIVMEQNRLYEVEKVQSELNERYYDRLEEISTNTNKYIHNLKEYLTAIGRLARENRNEDILHILEDMEAGAESIVTKRYTSNPLLNAILCEKEQIAEKAKVAMTISVEPQMELDFIKSGDMIVMMGNLLQNAIEAAGKGEAGFVDVSVNGSDEKFVVFIVENNYFEEVKNKDGHYYSAKRGYREYGLGIRCVEETVEKYGGILYLQHGDGIFKAILTISKKTSILPI